MNWGILQTFAQIGLFVGAMAIAAGTDSGAKAPKDPSRVLGVWQGLLCFNRIRIGFPSQLLWWLLVHLSTRKLLVSSLGASNNRHEADLSTLKHDNTEMKEMLAPIRRLAEAQYLGRYYRCNQKTNTGS